MTVYERYQLLARDASASGDRIAGENYLQHAEHYYRLMEAAKQNSQQQQQQQQQQQGNGNGQERQPDQRQRRNQSEQRPDSNATAASGSDEATASGNGETAESPPADNGNVAAGDTEQPSLNEDAPMSPAALAAEVEAMSESNGSAEAAPKRNPRRRRRPLQDAAAKDAAPQDAAAEADGQEKTDSDDGEAVSA